MSSKVKSNWRIGGSAVGLAGSLSLICLHLWAGLAGGHWEWGLIVSEAFLGFYLFPVFLLRELRKPRELVPGAPDPKEPNLSLFQ